MGVNLKDPAPTKEHDSPLQLVSTFCHDEISDPMNVHNKEAPNNHNRQCDYRSTWGVILNSVDSMDKNGAVNPTNPTIQNTDPIVMIVRPGPKRVVLIMDISGSMYGKRLNDLRSASELPISSLLGDGMTLGLVAFSESAVVLQPLTKIGYDDGNREKMIKSLPSCVNGSTGIGAGILEGIKVLSKNGLPFLPSVVKLPKGGQLIVLIDGEENAKPYIEDITAEAIKSGVVVDSIFFGLVDVSKDASLASLSLQTGGKWYYASTSDQSVSQLSGIFASLSKSDDGNFSANAVQVLNKIINLKPGTPDTVTAAIDGSLRSSSAKLIKYFLQFGIWEFSIFSTSENKITTAVTSRPSDLNVYPITVETELKVSDDTTLPPIVVAKVFQNFLPVLGASVNATVTRPDDTISVVELFDNGAGMVKDPNLSITADDIFPPNRITDLTASQVDLDNVNAGLLRSFSSKWNDYWQQSHK
ncbi:calcium-activated chloride channel regulator 1-like [Styela clava]